MRLFQLLCRDRLLSEQDRALVPSSVRSFAAIQGGDVVAAGVVPNGQMSNIFAGRVGGIC